MEQPQQQQMQQQPAPQECEQQLQRRSALNTPQPQPPSASGVLPKLASMAARSQQLAEVGVREEIVICHMHGINFQSVRPANQKICILRIPLSRQLEMAAQGAPLPDVTVGTSVQGRGAWMAFLWDARGSLVQEQVSFMFFV